MVALVDLRPYRLNELDNALVASSVVKQNNKYAWSRLGARNITALHGNLV